jgi:Flp pilus assembly pilin Flp
MAMNILRRFLRKPRPIKRAERYTNPRILAYYWDGGMPAGRRLKNISVTGAYLHTPERWYLGTIITVTLRRLCERKDEKGATLSVLCRVVRWGPDGVGLRFLLPRRENRLAMEQFVLEAAIIPYRNFAEAAKAKSGQALVEYALILPLLFLLMVNAVNFGAFFFAWITVANAARAGAQYAALGTVSAGWPHSPSSDSVHGLISDDMFSLPNRPSITIVVCRNNNGLITGDSPAACAATPADPEAPAYALTSVDVSYTYTPVVSLFDFPGLGIHATMPPYTIHRRVLMRALQ